MQNKEIEKLKKQVAQNEAKGNYNTAHHVMLKRLQPVEGVTPQNVKKTKIQEVANGKQDL